ncbi:MAG: peptidoglycan-associated lipoprotein Pal [Burkholderiales bacterium]|nr:peptidoglycan-associated lipoprotein Pal [Burkholderiales bacterium]MBH2015875.1 peptidoglycan-associated lipoprotein Pal [Burkholderiales bacterium]
MPSQSPTSSRPAASSTRLSLLASALAAAALLGACGSSVKLDENAGKPAPITDASQNRSGMGDGSAAPASNVAQVNLDANKAGDAAFGNLPKVVYFDFDSFVVKDEFRDGISGHAKRLNAAKAKKILIEGHTDERGGREYNLALGQKRAEAVQKSLTLLGVSADQVEAVSYGEERPAASGSTEEAWAQNRRAELKDR